MDVVRTLPHPDLNTPTVRMLTALLASTDPYGYVEAGNPPAAYTHTAWAVALRLEADLGPEEVMDALAPSADPAAARRFAMAALQWWDQQRTTRVVRVDDSASA